MMPVIFDDQNKNLAMTDNLVIASSADWHFGKLDPEYQYNIIKNQIINPLYNIRLDVFAILGDTFDHKVMANSKAVMYAGLIIKECVQLCKTKGATFVILAGTLEHDADQLKLFYPYLSDKDLDIRIVEKLKFEYIKGCKVLCIPEEYNKSEEYYNEFLFKQGLYDFALMHGMYKGTIYQEEIVTEDNVNPRNKLFTMDDFNNCRGFILSGHVHVPGCFNRHFYYCGNPYTWQFGEECDKGFFITLYNKFTHQYYNHFQVIVSDKYETVNIDDMLDLDPKDVISFIESLLVDIAYVRIECLNASTEAQIANLNIIKTYFSTNTKIKFKNESIKKKKILQSIKEENKNLEQFMFVLDPNMSYLEKLAMYINIKEGKEYTTAQEIEQLMLET